MGHYPRSGKVRPSAINAKNEQNKAKADQNPWPPSLGKISIFIAATEILPDTRTFILLFFVISLYIMNIPNIRIYFYLYLSR